VGEVAENGHFTKFLDEFQSYLYFLNHYTTNGWNLVENEAEWLLFECDV